jgi:hypothetical protein
MECLQTGKSHEFFAMSEADQIKTLYEETQKVFHDIEETRTNLKNDHFNLWTHPNIRNAAYVEEFVHIQQISDPVMRAKMLKLTEGKLANWAQMGPKDRLDLIRTKLEVKADAQRRLINDGPVNVNKDLARVHLEGIETKLSKIAEAQYAVCA